MPRIYMYRLPINLGASLALQEAADSFLRTDGAKRGGIHKFIKRYQATGTSHVVDDHMRRSLSTRLLFSKGEVALIAR